MDPSKVEILVHIAASSTAKDDARYRALARNYLNFVPATRLELEDPPEDEEMQMAGGWNAPIEEQVDSQLNDELRSNVGEESEVKSWESYQPGQEEEVEADDDDISEALPTQQSPSQEHRSSRRSFDSAELSFQSAANNADSPTFRYRGITCAQLPPPAQPHVESQESTDSWKPPRSTISDSQPEYNRPSQGVSSPTRVLENYVQRIDNSEPESQESARSQRQRNRNEASARISESQKTSSSDIRDFAFVRSSSSVVQASLPQKADKPVARPPATIPGTPTPIEISSLEIPPTPIFAPGQMLPPSEIHVSFKLRSGNIPRGTSSSSVRSGSQTVANKTTIPESFEHIEDLSKVASTVPKKTTIPDSFEHTKSTPSTSKGPSSVPKKTTIAESSEYIEALSLPKATSNVENSSLTSSTTNAEKPPSDKPSLVSNIIMIPKKSLRDIPRTPYRGMNTTADSSIALKRKLAERSTGAEVPDSTAADSPSVIPETVIRPTKRTKFTLTRPFNAPSVSSPNTQRTPKTPSTPTAMDQANSPQAAKRPSTPAVMEPETEPQAETTPTKAREPAHVAPQTPRSCQSTPLFSSPPGASQFPAFVHETEIRPDPPATGHDHITPESLITSALHALAVKAPFEKFFLPEYQKREIGPWDRGYWLVHSSGWDQSVKETCWNFLGNFITQNKGGWTIWCERKEDFSEIRVYCWGIMVPHVFLLLYAASKNRIRRVETWWMGDSVPPGPVPVMGAEKVPLIKMPVKE